MWKYYNPNPTGAHVGDCSVRAVTKATGEDWDTAYCGVSLQGMIMKNMPSANAVWGSYLRRKGFKRKMLPDECPECYTVEQFCEDNPEGLYVVAVQNHVLTVLDGDYYDAWDSGKETPIFYYYIESEDE